MEDDDALLSAGFAIDTQGAFSELQRFYQFFDAGTIRVLDEIRKVEQATGGMMNLSAATREVNSFSTASRGAMTEVAKSAEGAAAGIANLANAITTTASAATREERALARERAQNTKEIERRIAAVDREVEAFGRSKAELRDLRDTELLVTAAQHGNTDAVDRLSASLRSLSNHQRSAAEDRLSRELKEQAEAAREAARAEALLNGQLLERSRLHSAISRIDGTDRPRAAAPGMGATYSALAEREREVELAQKATAAERELSVVTARQNSLLAERAQIEAAIERNTGVGRGRATDAGATFSALAARAAEEEAEAVRKAAFAYDQFEAARIRGLAAHREAEAATARDADTLARLRAMIDPAAAAQNRLNVELAEARRVMAAAGASAEELAAAEDALWARSMRATQQHDAMAGSARRSGFALQTIALQLPDITQGLLTGQKPMTVFIQQGFQIVQVAQMAEGGLRGFGKEVAGLALRFAPALAALALAGAGFALFNRWVNEGVKHDQLTADLGRITGGANATKEELYKLREASITWGDTMSALFSVVGKDIAESFVGDMKHMSKQTKETLDDLTSYGRKALAGMYALAAGTQSYMGQISSREGFAKLLTGDPTLVDRTYGEAYRKADKYLSRLGDRVKAQAITNARHRLAESIGFNAPKTAKVDRHAEQMARDAEAVEAQIRNMYKLADAYEVSGAAALIAEARVKAESDAIKKRGDIEAFADRQLRLAIAERVKTGSQNAAAMQDEINEQRKINAEIAAGTIPAALANELLRDRLADLPLLAAREAAWKKAAEARASGDVAGYTEFTKAAEKAAAAEDKVRKARTGLNDEQRQAALLAAQSDADEQLAYMREELRLLGATELVRARSLATFKAEQAARAKGWTGSDADAWIKSQGDIAAQGVMNSQAVQNYNDLLSETADRWDAIARNVSNAGRGMADAFGAAGQAIGDLAGIYASYSANRAQAELKRDEAIRRGANAEREQTRFALANSTARIGMYGDMTAAAKGFFKEGSDGYRALATAEKVFRAVEFALSVRSIAQDAIETGSKIAGSVARTAAHATEAVVKAISGLPFPLNIAAGAATIAALAGIGVSVVGSLGGGGKNTLAKANDGTGTVLGNSEAKSESIKNAIDALKEVDQLTNVYARQMAASLKSIDGQIGKVASLVVRSGDVNASAGITEGFNNSTGKAVGTGVGGAIGAVAGSVLGPVGTIVGGLIGSTIGKLIGGLFGTSTTVIGSGLYGGAQSLGSILEGGFAGQTYSDVQKKSKFLGITTSTKNSTQYGALDPTLNNQFTLILRSFSDAIGAAAGPLGESTQAVQDRLNGFVVNIGKIDLKGLTGDQIQEKLTAVFGAAADNMANAAFPGIARFQKVGEGVFETLVRVASTVEGVTTALDQLGASTRSLGIDAKLGLADQFDSLSDLTGAVGSYFEAFYSKEEQAAAKTAQLTTVFTSLGLVLPTTLAGFRQLVEAQDLSTASGQATYATLLKLAPAFADLKSAMEGAKSAADILSERQNLQRQLLELNGDTAAIRALDLAKVDVSNRALQEQVWAIQDAQKAADAAKQLSDAWTSIGDTITDEVKRIRGLSDTTGATSFAMALSSFNAATIAARGGDQDVAKTLPSLSQALLTIAGNTATSRQELDRVRAETAASLEQTGSVIAALAKSNPLSSSSAVAAAATTAQATAPAATSTADTTADELRRLRETVEAMRGENNAGHATTAATAGRSAKVLERAEGVSGGAGLGVVLVDAA